MEHTNQAVASVSASAQSESLAEVWNMQSNANVLDKNFPLFLSVFETAKIPILFVYPFLTFFFIQFIIVSIWPWNPYWESQPDKHIMKWLRTVLFFVPQPAEHINYLIVSIVIFVINMSILIIIESQLFYYKIQRKFVIALNYPIRLYFDAILVATITPAIVGTGETFVLLCHGQTNYKIIIAFILYALSVAYESYSFFIVQNFAAKSICINVSPLLNFDPTLMIMTLITMLVCLLPYFLLTIFEYWVQLVAIGLNILLYIYLFYYTCCNIPYVDVMTMGLALGWYSGCTFGDITIIIGTFNHSMTYKIPLYGSIAVFVGLTGPSLLYFILRIKSIRKQLDVDYIKQEEANNYYTELGLDKNQNKALCYLKIAFQTYCPSFYNWTLILFLMEHYDSETVISLCLQLLTFFPKETRLQNRLERMLSKRRTLSFKTRYLIFQIQTLKSLRQFDASAQIKLKLIELKNMSRNLENMTKAAIDAPKLEISYFEDHAVKAQSNRAIWKESLLTAPNNPKFCEEYARYLIEAECDFPEGLKIKNRQQSIEMGKTYSVDFSFRSMVEAFPKYLTEKILDLNGGVRKKELSSNGAPTSGRSTTGSSGSNQNSTNDESTELEAEVEEFIGKHTIKQARERLALHRMMENKLSSPIKAITPISIFIVLFIVIIFSIGVSTATIQLKTYVNDMKLLSSIADTRFFVSLSNSGMLAEFFREAQKLQRYTTPMKQYLRETDRPYLDLYNFMLPSLINYTTKAAEAYDTFNNLAMRQALTGFDINLTTKGLLANKAIFTTCPMAVESPISLANLVGAFLVDQRIISGKSNVLDIMTNLDSCELSLNFVNFFSHMDSAFADITQEQYELGKSANKYFRNLSILIPVITFVGVFIPFFINHYRVQRSLKELIEIIQSFDSKAKQEARELIMLNLHEEEMKATEMRTKTYYSTCIIFLICIISIIFLGLTFAGSRLVLVHSTQLMNLNSWNKFASQRLCLSAETLSLLFTLTVVHTFPNVYQYRNVSVLGYMTMKMAQMIVDADNTLLNGDKDHPPCQGFNEELDQLNFIDGALQNNVNDPSEYYANASIHTQVQTYYSYLNAITKSAQVPGGSLNTLDIANTLYLADYRMFYKCYRVCSLIIELGEKSYSQMKDRIILLSCMAGIDVIFFIMVISIYIINRKLSYKAGITILKRFSPYALMNNKIFNRVFLKGKLSENDDKLSIEGLVIRNANDTILCSNLNGTVEVRNNSSSQLLGYTADQILGQHITLFFSAKSQETIVNKMEMMKSGQASSFVEEDLFALTDANSEIPVHVTIIGMKKDENDSNINSFVFILRDQSNLVIQKQQAEEAKAKSEKLLYQILPRDIVLQLNKGEKDISFVVPSATIIFIDINRFSEYAANLSPQDIMANLSTYFACIDKTAAKYNMVQKIKLIGDIYMAATGLFNPDSSPESHADQTVQFAHDCLGALDEVNIKLTSNLQIRIGVNTGGPIIAGVLGTDKPVFDIIGDPINVAARLQSTAEVNKVHISQSTYELLKGFSYQFIQRGETFLKGKGKQMTYYVNLGSTWFGRNNSAHIFKVSSIDN